MEIVLSFDQGDRVGVQVDGRTSHHFDYAQLFPEEGRGDDHTYLIREPEAFGAGLYAALFPQGSPAREALEAGPGRVLLVAEEPVLDAVPWEYLYGPDGFLVLEQPFVRSLPAPRRRPPPELGETPLHILAVPSNPIAPAVVSLDIEGEWTRLREIVGELEHAVRLERCRPPTLARLGDLAAGARDLVVHFMGHGGQGEEGGLLLFEDGRGASELAEARDLAAEIGEEVFLVSLNACVSATPGETRFANLARLLVEAGVTYALGMRFEVPDTVAKAFAWALYAQLGRGVPLERAVQRARRRVASRADPWLAGLAVLYTSLDRPADGFARLSGAPDVDEKLPPIEVAALPRAQGAFQGRALELLALGERLAGDGRAKLLTIHGGGGQGKTALAREAVDRFAHAWPGGVWALSLESLPTRFQFAAGLAHFLGIDLAAIQEIAARERPGAPLEEVEALVAGRPAGAAGAG